MFSMRRGGGGSFPSPDGEEYTTEQHIQCWVSFFMISLASGVLAPFVLRLGMPKLTGYLVVGAVCGPYALDLVSKDDVYSLRYINTFALAFITTSAGAELHIPELKRLFKTIAAQTIWASLLIFVGTALVTKALASTPLSSFTNSMSDVQQWAVALIMAALAMTGSPAGAVAVVRELKCKGEMTTTLMGIIALADIVVLIAIPVCLSYAGAQFNGEVFQATTAGVVALTIVASCIVGGVVGLGYMTLMRFRRSIIHILIFPLGFAVFLGCQYLTEELERRITDKSWHLELEPLLLCIVGGFVTVNFSKYHHRFIETLEHGGPYIFLPFFTLVGASLDLETFAQALPFAIILALLRAVCMFVGTASAGYLVGQERFLYRTMWMTLISQAGFSLGLAAEIGLTFEGWGEQFQAVIISCVVVNQLAGPVLCKVALQWSGEAGKASGLEAQEEAENDPDDEHVADRHKVVVVGVTPQSKALALAMLKRRWGVTVLTTTEDEAARLRGMVAAWAADERADLLRLSPADPAPDPVPPPLESNFSAHPVAPPSDSEKPPPSHPFLTRPASILRGLNLHPPPSDSLATPSSPAPLQPAPGAPSLLLAPELTDGPNASSLSPPDSARAAGAPHSPRLAPQSFVDKCGGVYEVLDGTEGLHTVVLALESDLASLALLETLRGRWSVSKPHIRVLVFVKDLIWAEPIAMLNGTPLHPFVSAQAAASLAAATPCGLDAVLAAAAPSEEATSHEYLSLFDGNVLFHSSDHGKSLRDEDALQVPTEALATVLSAVRQRLQERSSPLTGGRLLHRIEAWLHSLVGPRPASQTLLSPFGSPSTRVPPPRLRAAVPPLEASSEVVPLVPLSPSRSRLSSHHLDLPEQPPSHPHSPRRPPAPSSQQFALPGAAIGDARGSVEELC